jgi:hypothetical protein
MRFIVTASVISIVLLLVACGATPPTHQTNCPNNTNGYIIGEATPQFVESCMGKPQRIDRNGPGGQYSYWYDLRGGAGTPGGVSVGFVFDTSDKLVRAVAYGAK